MPFNIFSLSISKTIKALILLAIALVPVMNWQEISSLLFRGIARSEDVEITSTPIKLLKDYVFFLIILLGLINFLKNKKLFTDKLYLSFLILSIFSFLLSVYDGIPFILLSGFRWLLPFLLLLFLYDTIDEEFQRKIAKLLIALFLLGLFLQVYGVFFGFEMWGVGLFGGRNPGLFLYPSTMAIFTALAMYYIYNFIDDSIPKKVLIYFFCPLSMLLTASGAGVVVMSVFFMAILFFKIKRKEFFFLFLLLFIFLLVIFLPTITGRQKVYTGGLIRLEVFTETVDMSKLFISTNFGSGTNTALRMLGEFEEELSDSGRFTIVDSMISSIISNTGVLSFIIFFLFVIKVFRWRTANLHFLIIYMVFMLTSIFFESFPANLLFVVNLAYFYKNEKKHPRRKIFQETSVYSH